MPLAILKPFFLWVGMCACLFVLALHLLTRRKPRVRVSFSNLRVLREVLSSQLPRKRLERFLLLILRILSIALIFLALAKPYSSFNGALQQSPSPIFWFVYDLSYSMDYRDATGSSRITLATKLGQDLARAIFREIPKARVGILAYSDKIHENLNMPPTSDNETLSLALNRLRAFPRATRQALWVERLSLAADKEPSSGAFVFSDFAQHGFIDPLRASYLKTKSVPLSPLVFINLNPKNYFNRQLNVSLEQESIVVDVRCQNVSASSSQQLFIQEALTNKLLATPVAALCQKTFLPLSGIVKNNQESVLRFSLKEDPLLMDDAQVLVVPAQVTAEILLVDGEPGARAQDSEGFYIRQIFRGLPPRYLWRLVTQNDLEDFPELGSFMDDVDELWLLHPQRLGPRLEKTLRDFVGKPTKKLVLSLGPRADQEALKRVLGLDLGLIQTNNAQSLRALKQELESFELNRVRLNHYFLIGSKIPREKVWLAVAQDPLFFEFPSTGARVFVYASTFDLEWGNIPLKGVFYSLIKTLLEDRGNWRFESNKLVGEMVRLPQGVFGENPRLFSAESVEVERKFKGGEVWFGPLEEPGLYQFVGGRAFLTQQGQMSSYLSVRFPEGFGESDLKAATNKDFVSLLGRDVFYRKITPEDFFKDPARALSFIRAKEFNRSLLIAALIFLLAESGLLLAKRK